MGNDPAMGGPNHVRFSQNFQDTFFCLKITFFGPNFFDLKKTKKKTKTFSNPPPKKNFFDLKKTKKKTKNFSTPPKKNFFSTKKKTFSTPPKKFFLTKKKKKKKKKKS